MRGLATALLLLVVALFIAGCAGVVYPYSMSIDNVQKLKDNGNFSAKIGEFNSTPGPENANPLRIRANSASSPYHGSFANYISEALKEELVLANKLAPNSKIEISGTLLKNNVDVGGISTATGNIQVRFIVKNNGEVRYDQIKSAHHEWDSSYAAAIAVPHASQEYPILVQKLLGSLFDDPVFLQALK
jgi:hypothetical protein